MKVQRLLCLAIILISVSCSKEKEGPKTLAFFGVNYLTDAQTPFQAVTLKNFVFFVGSTTTVNIYNVETNTWKTVKKGSARFNMGVAAAGNKVLFAGGIENSSSTNLVDIYNIEAQQWTTTYLSQARHSIGAASAGDKVVFAGGTRGILNSDIVDIYDVKTDKWTTAKLSEPRSGIAAIASGNKIYFGGGFSDNFSKTIDIYDVQTGIWKTSKLSVAKTYLSAATLGNHVVFAGGTGETNSFAAVDILNVSDNSVKTISLRNPRTYLTTVALNDYILFAGGRYENILMTDMIEVYNIKTGLWETNQTLSKKNINVSAARVNNKILFAGEANYTEKTAVVDIFELK